MVAWSVELSEFGLRFEPQDSIKGQHLADFATELLQSTNEPLPTWHLNVDGSLDKKGGGAGIIVEGPNGLIIEQAVSFNFQTSNNQAEYEALIADLILARELEVEHLECRMDSQLVFGHMNGIFQVKDNQLLRYFHKVSDLTKGFSSFNIVHVPRTQKAREDLLSKLTHARDKAQLSSVIKMTLDKPILEAFTTNITAPKADWRQDIIQLMTQQEQRGQLSATDSKRIARFMFIGDDMYK